MEKIYKASTFDVDTQSSTEGSSVDNNLQWKAENRFYGYKVFISGSLSGDFKDLQIQALDKSNKVVSYKDCNIENNFYIKNLSA